MWHVVRGGMVHHMVHDGITWCITHLVRYMARLRKLEVGGSVDVVQRKGKLRWGKASGGMAKGTSLPPPFSSPPLFLSFDLRISLLFRPSVSRYASLFLFVSMSPYHPLPPRPTLPPLLGVSLTFEQRMRPS